MPVDNGEFYNGSAGYDGRTAYIMERMRVSCCLRMHDAMAHAGDADDPIEPEPDEDDVEAYRTAAAEFDQDGYIAIVLRRMPFTLDEDEVVNVCVDVAMAKNACMPLDIPGAPRARGRRIGPTDMLADAAAEDPGPATNPPVASDRPDASQ